MTVNRMLIAWLLAVALCLSACDPLTVEQLKLSEEDGDALVSLAREYLRGNEQADDSRLGVSVAQADGRRVFVTLFTPGHRWMRAEGQEKSVADSLKAACMQLRTKKGFVEHYAKNSTQARLAVHLIDREYAMEAKDAEELLKMTWLRRKNIDKKTMKRLDKIAGRVEPGIHGLKLEYNGEKFYQLGEDVLFHGWGMKGFRDGDRVAGAKLMRKRLGKLLEDAAIGRPEDGQSKDIKISYFSTIGFVEEKPDKAFTSYRALRLTPKEITRRELLEAAWLAARHLAMHVDQLGRFGYHYRPVFDEFADEKYYNIVRHAGSVWALFQAYKATGDESLLDTGIRTLNYLGAHIKTAAENEHIAYLDYQGKSRLGTNALATLSLVEIPPEALDDQWRERREKLGNSLIAFQVEDGRFYKTWTDVLKGGPVPEPQEMYAPGEAFLALVRLQEVDPQDKWLKAAEKCAAAQMKQWDAKPDIQPDAWVIQAMSRLYRINRDERLPRYVFQMVEWHFRHQWGMPEKGAKTPYEDYLGGADNSTPPRSTPTSARTEANIEAWHLARLVGDRRMEQRIGDAVMASYRHNMIDQFRPETAYYVKHPEKAVGGIRGSLISNDIRIDYNQHFLSAALNGLDLAESRHGLGKFGPLAEGKIKDMFKGEPAAE